MAAELAVAHLLKTFLVTGQKEALDSMPSAIWTMPENAFVGQTTEQLVRAGKVLNVDFVSSKGYFADTAKWALRRPHEINEAMVLDSTERENAFIKILFHPTSRVVFGIHIVGPTAAELIQYADSCIGKPLDFILRTAPTAVTFCCAFADAAIAGKGSLTQEATNFSGPYEFIKSFLSYGRKERMRSCKEAFTNGNPDDQKSLEKTIQQFIDCDPEDQAEQALVMNSIHEILNRLLMRLEEAMWQNQAPQWLDGAVPKNAIVAVIGGKHTSSFRGSGDWIVSLFLQYTKEMPMGHLFSHTCSAADDPPEGSRYSHHKDLGELMKAVAEKKEQDPSASIVFVYTTGHTGANGQNKVNQDSVETFINELASNDLLHDENVKVLHTSTFHASPKEAGHEDSLEDNYVLADYATSKVMQTLQLAEALFKGDPRVNTSDIYTDLKKLKGA